MVSGEWLGFCIWFIHSFVRCLYVCVFDFAEVFCMNLYEMLKQPHRTA